MSPLTTDTSRDGFTLAGVYVGESADFFTPLSQFTTVEEEVSAWPDDFTWSPAMRHSVHFSISREQVTQFLPLLFPTVGPVWLDLFTPDYARIIRGTSHA